MRARHVAAVALVLGLTVTGFFVARALTERDARRDSERRAEVAAAQIHGRIEQATSLTESLRRYMYDAGGTGVTSDQFTRNALRWLSPAGFPAAAWGEQVQASDRTAYEREIGQPIVTLGARDTIVPRGSSYLPATLVSGFPPMDLRGVDLSREAGIAVALRGATSPGGVSATPVTSAAGRASGLFLVAPAPNLIDGILRPGAVVVFVPEATLRASAGNPPGLRLDSTGESLRAADGGHSVRKDFFVAGRPFAAVMPKESVNGSAAALPWIILAAGLVLSALLAGLGVIAGRRAKAQAELDRIFNISSDLIAVADFEGRFTRVNPAVEQVLGYTPQEFLERPYLELVHPEDRERTAVEAAALVTGTKTLSFENRYRHKDGSYRVLEWTSTPVVQDEVIYGVARDISERRRAEAERGRLADEQAALRRVATLIAEGASPSTVLDAVATELEALLQADGATLSRYEPDSEVVVLAHSGTNASLVPPGTQVSHVGENVTSIVRRTQRPARMQSFEGTEGAIAGLVDKLGVRAAVGAPIVVDGRPWGLAIANWQGEQAPPADTERRIAMFTDLVATAIANAEARAEVERLADEQAGLRRVATLVAEGVPPGAILDAVAREMETLLDADQVALNRFEPDDEITVLAHRGLDVTRTPVGSRLSIAGDSATAIVRRTGRPARMEGYETAEGPVAELARETGLRSSVSAPIVVDGRLWGLITASWKHAESPPAGTEERMARFAELLDTSIANADARDQLTASRARLVTEGDAARRRVVRDLHDGAQQRLVHTIVTLKLAQRAFAEGHGKAESLVGEALNQAETSNAELRELAHGILPSVLTRGGLREGVDTVVQRIDLPVEVDVPPDRFPPEAEANAYFVIAEALTNVIKHSHAKSAKVTAEVRDGSLVVAVRDDGIGGADPNGRGLVGISDRVTALGGRLEVETPPGGGTLVSATLRLSGG